MSRELILSMSVSIDGFVAGPNGEHDWMLPARSEASTQWLADQFGQVSLHAIGHRSYEMAAFWPTATGPFAPHMNGIPKAVFSRSGAISTALLEKVTAAIKEATKDKSVDQEVVDSWLHPIVAGKDLVADINRLKAEDGKPINAIGGASFASSLIAANLVDVFRLAVHPVALGRGLPIFAGLESPLRFKLEDLKQFDTGAVIKTYRPIYLSQGRGE